ncbi:hypothetical protein DITRI_Ditri17bG0045900 [Diplodiscus trichospermus]
MGWVGLLCYLKSQCQCHNHNGPFPMLEKNFEFIFLRTAAASSVVEPSEGSIATLVSMGFDRNSARQALVHARNDVNAATNILLEAESH